jgi:hypothetical protein
MPVKRYKPERIVNLLRQAEVEIANGETTPQACNAAEITVHTYYRWRKSEEQGFSFPDPNRKIPCFAFARLLLKA